ncbi:MAG: helix-turn-helix transcriptional regulator [Tumebacillaceae bacterium]
MSVSVKNPVAVPIGSRIGEILEERGSAFSIRAFSGRIGMSKDMLSRMISGDRYISPSELELIANGLSLSVARLKQEDTANLVHELKYLLENKKNYNRALEVVLELKSKAVGCSERFFVSKEAGNVYYSLKKYDEAHGEWLEAQGHAEQIADKYKDTEPLYTILDNLVLSFTEKKDIVGLSTLLAKLQPLFRPFPDRMGTLFYSSGVMAFRLGNYRQARDHFVQAMELYDISGLHLHVGKCEHNVGYMEYLLENYSTAIGHFERAMPLLAEDDSRFVTVKDYVKALLKLGLMHKAKQIITETLSKLDKLDLHARRAQFVMLYAIVNEDINAAKQVLEYQGVAEPLKALACKFLMNYYSRIGDAENLMRYYRIADTYTSEQSAIYDEMGI